MNPKEVTQDGVSDCQDAFKYCCLHVFEHVSVSAHDIN
jgi:hypothetical protein